MRYKLLGNTGLRISSISLGTAELGLDYGFKNATNGSRPDRKDAIKLIHRALDAGINCLDTARAYGTSEEIIGAALNEVSASPTIVSKVLLPDHFSSGISGPLRREIMSSIETSLQLLGVDTLDVLLIHNTSHKALQSEEVKEALMESRKQGKIRFFGASCYADDLPASVLSYPDYRVVQAPFNLLDQKMNAGFFEDAVKNGVGVFARSIYLRGVLTPQVDLLPERLFPLKEAALRALKVAGSEVKSLSELALRFCLSLEVISSVLIGVKTVSELESNLADAEKGALPEELMIQLRDIDFGVNPIVDTRTWEDIVI